MNAAGIRALEQARGYYREGVVNATKRVEESEEFLAAVRETWAQRVEAAEQALVDVTGQLVHAQEQVDELDAALAEAQGVES